jgi:hypothetical protein
MLSVHGSDAIGGDAAGSDHHSHRIFSFDTLISRRPRSSPIQRCINPLSNHYYSALLLNSFSKLWDGLDMSVKFTLIGFLGL